MVARDAKCQAFWIVPGLYSPGSQSRRNSWKRMVKVYAPPTASDSTDPPCEFLVLSSSDPVGIGNKTLDTRNGNVVASSPKCIGIQSSPICAGSSTAAL